MNIIKPYTCLKTIYVSGNISADYLLTKLLNTNDKK